MNWIKDTTGKNEALINLDNIISIRHDKYISIVFEDVTGNTYTWEYDTIDQAHEAKQELVNLILMDAT